MISVIVYGVSLVLGRVYYSSWSLNGILFEIQKSGKCVEQSVIVYGVDVVSHRIAIAAGA